MYSRTEANRNTGNKNGKQKLRRKAPWSATHHASAQRSGARKNNMESNNSYKKIKLSIVFHCYDWHSRWCKKGVNVVFLPGWLAEKMGKNYARKVRDDCCGIETTHQHRSRTFECRCCYCILRRCYWMLPAVGPPSQPYDCFCAPFLNTYFEVVSSSSLSSWHEKRLHQ